MRIGYARVSTAEQNLDLQHDALNGSGCERIYEEQVSGKNADRPALTNCLKALRPGDMLVVWRLDRLGRNLPDLIKRRSLPNFRAKWTFRGFSQRYPCWLLF
jgi:DNA invertase Pin-like site-specific DNA recombinase